MSNVWKVGSRWSENGAKESSIISIFRRNNVVFVGQEDRRIAFRDSVKQGDYIAIADGYTIVAVAKAISTPTCITKLNIRVTAEEAMRFNPQDCNPDDLWNQVFSAVRVPPRFRNGTEAYMAQSPLNIVRYLINSFVGEGNCSYITPEQNGGK